MVSALRTTSIPPRLIRKAVEAVTGTQFMDSYKRVEQAALLLNTSVDALLEFAEMGWISTVEKDGGFFLSSHQSYRARFILDLRHKWHLKDYQITKVLAEQTPPFSLTDITRILNEPVH